MSLAASCPAGARTQKTMSDNSIPVSTEMRNRLRRKKGYDRTYDEFFAELLEDDDEIAHTERNASPEARSQ
ncbi:hypothetical protein SAMN05443574_13512 [Haloarcula vallismortis]|uniref:Uncharacterized protein n=2 Tax=Haloarcula vallismortis TaxID=28442 RepID=M0J569_HALVA|nr:hypothetical protein C437_14042 [Haloarcula vallismortis ATCC 29715]SDX35452.1 hypothetical protein SAMN05443574_13512 [Haloarcula vallismortis]